MHNTNYSINISITNVNSKATACAILKKYAIEQKTAIGTPKKKSTAR